MLVICIMHVGSMYQLQYAVSQGHMVHTFLYGMQKEMQQVFPWGAQVQHSPPLLENWSWGVNAMSGCVFHDYTSLRLVKSRCACNIAT